MNIFTNFFKNENYHEESIIKFLNDQEQYISTFKSLHIGFFYGDSVNQLILYVTGAPIKLSKDDDLDNADYFYYEFQQRAGPLEDIRYLRLNNYPDTEETEDNMKFLEKIRNLFSDSINNKKFAKIYKEASLITYGWDSGDLLILKDNR